MKKKLAKLLALVLALTMLTGLMTVTAFADDESDDYSEWQARYEENMQDFAEATGSYYEPCATVSTTEYVTSNGFKYTLDGNNAAITGYEGSLTSITVPASVDGHPVVTIADLNNRTLTSITLSEGIKEIKYCAFLLDTALTYVYIPSSIETIGFAVFDKTTKLQTIEVNSQNNNYVSVDGVLFSKGKDTLICYPAGKTASSYSIPATVKEIDGWAFSCAANLTSVTIPYGVEEIDLDAFVSCTALASISLPDSLKDIALSAFEKCTSLTEVTIPKSVIYYSSDAFTYCSSLKNIYVSPENTLLTSIDGVVYSKDKTILHSYPCGRQSSFFKVPAGTLKVDENSFEGCTNIKSVDLPNGLTDIDFRAFYNCTSLTDITIPQSLGTVDSYAFRYCESLTDVYYRGTEAQKSGITIESGNDPFKNATWHYNTSDEFADVSTGDWFYGNVIFVNEAGIMTGQGGTNKFAPGQSLQRQEFANILWRLAGELPATYVAKFPDVPDGTWFTTPIMWAYKNGVITGYASGNFGVGDNVTREQFATMLYRYAKEVAGIQITGSVDISSYPDAANVSPWALDAMKWAVGNGIITGKGGVYLDPAGNASRCEGAAMIERYMKKFMQN